MRQIVGKRVSWVVLAAVVVSVGLLHAQTRRRAASPAARTAQPPKYKGVFEPVNYSEDVIFNDVWFADADHGWAVGQATSSTGGFILGTKDGGKSWNVQLGDPHSNESGGITQIFFLDATHGFATQWAEPHLLRTTDGESWEPMGDVSVLGDFTFISPENGFAIDNQQIKATADGGRTWKPVYQCHAKIEVQGLAREENCQLESIGFAPDHQTGYAISRALSDKSSLLVKSSDGGQTWINAGFVPQFSGKDGRAFFRDAQTGFVTGYGASGYGALVATKDGGQTWHSVNAATPQFRLRFAGPVGWDAEGDQVSYSTDGGVHWNSTHVSLPAKVHSFAVASPQVAYVVGDHGMVYRYRVVPFAYTAPKMITAPVMALPTDNP